MHTPVTRRSALEWVVIGLLALFAISIPSENAVTLPGIGSVTRLLGVLVVPLGLIALIEGGRVRLREPSLFLVVCAVLALWVVASYFWSLFPSTTMSQGITFLQLAAFVAMVWLYSRDAFVTRFLLQSFVFGVILAIAIGATSFFSSGEFRDVGPFNANGYAIIAAVAVPIAWYLATQWRSRLLTFVNYCYPLIAVFAVVISASRGGFITLLVALLVIPLTLNRLSVLRRVLLYLVLAVGAWLTVAYLPSAFPSLALSIERLADTGDELAGGDLTGRTTIWGVAVHFFLDKPITGIGTGAFPEAAAAQLGRPQAPHNTFLEAAVGNGLVGLLLFVGLFVITLVTILRMDSSRRAYLLVALAALVVGLMPSNAYNAKYLWFLLALLAHQSPVLYLSLGGTSDEEPAFDYARAQ
mgnify:FL=1